MNNPYNRRQFLRQTSILVAGVVLPVISGAQNQYKMQEETVYDVIIIGGSYAGLSAALALGRAIRKVLIIDSGNPSNKQTPYSHNFLTQDGEPPFAIAAKARKQLETYATVSFLEDTVSAATKTTEGFTVEVSLGTSFKAKKLLFSTGVKDRLPDIPGFSACWGISILHCPYCHGYEVRDQPTGILGNGDMAFEKAKLIANWTKELTLFTNGSSTLSDEQKEKLTAHHITMIEKTIKAIVEEDGHINRLEFTDGSSHPLKALYASPPLDQHSNIPETMGCAMTESNFIQTDEFKKTSVPGIYAAGDNTGSFRSVALAVASGAVAGAMLNKELIDEAF